MRRSMCHSHGRRSRGGDQHPPRQAEKCRLTGEVQSGGRCSVLLEKMVGWGEFEGDGEGEAEAEDDFVDSILAVHFFL